ncbi:MAG: hypothetical protein ABH914_02475 [Candidatus Omnitrophota bacterium]
MKADLKIKIILLLALLSIALIISLVSSSCNAVKQRKLLGQERMARIGLEERVLSLSNLNTDLSKEVTQLEETLDKGEIANQQAQQALSQRIKGLELELEKVTKLKEKLEENLKDMLVVQPNE